MDINQILDQAETSHRSGNLPEAAGLYRKVLAQNPDHGDALYGLGTILLQQKEYPTAQEYLQKAVNILPDVPEFLFNLALIQEITGDIRDAQANYCHAALNAGDRGPFLLQICKKMIGLDLARQALPYLNAIHPQTPEVVWWKSRAQGAIGYWGSALKNLSWLTKKFPKDTTLWREHSVAAGHMRDFDLAITSFYTYMANKTVDGHDFLALADLYLMARKPDDAQEAIQKAFDLGLKNKADAFFIAGKCARLRGDYKAVRKNLDKAVILRPTFGKAWQMLFEIMDKDEIAPQADRCSSLAKDQNCTDRDRISLALATGQAYEKIDQFGKAFMAFEQANDSHKNLLENQGHIYDPHEAEEEAKKIIDHYPAGTEYQKALEEQPKQPIFILGMPRTGTTLVERILGCLDSVETGGENDAMEHIARGYYQAVAQGEITSPTALTASQLTEMANEYWQRTPLNNPIITDKMPHNFYHIGLITQIFPKAPIIYMNRDPRDVCLSIYCRLFPDVHRYAVDQEWLGHFYGISERLKRHWLTTFPNRILNVVYEDLIKNPTDKTKEIAAFCKLDWRPDCLDFHKHTTTSFTFSELQVRRPINRKGIGKWNKYKKELLPLINSLKKSGYI